MSFQGTLSLQMPSMLNLHTIRLQLDIMFKHHLFQACLPPICIKRGSSVLMSQQPKEQKCFAPARPLFFVLKTLLFVKVYFTVVGFSLLLNRSIVVCHLVLGPSSIPFSFQKRKNVFENT